MHTGFGGTNAAPVFLTYNNEVGVPVTHTHPLHVDLDVQCLCCLAPQPFHFTSLIGRAHV